MRLRHVMTDAVRHQLSRQGCLVKDAPRDDGLIARAMTILHSVKIAPAEGFQATRAKRLHLRALRALVGSIQVQALVNPRKSLA